MPQSDKTNSGDPFDADYELVVTDQEVPGIETYWSVLRLVLGAALEGSDELLQRLRAYEEARPPDAVDGQAREDETALDQVRFALIGLLFEAPETAARGVIRAAEMTEKAGRAGEKVLGPVARSWAFGPIRRRYQKYQARAQSMVDHWIEIGRAEEPYGRDMVQTLIPEIIDDVITAFADNEAIQDLIKAQGDEYIQYLDEENPEAIQDLVQGQTLGMTTEIMDEVRERTVTADSLLEMMVRSLLRRTPRQDLPEPPPTVKARAVITRKAERQGFVQERVEDDE